MIFNLLGTRADSRDQRWFNTQYLLINAVGWIVTWISRAGSSIYLVGVQSVTSKVSLFYLVLSNSNRSVLELKDNWPYVSKLFWQPLGLLGSSAGLLLCQFATGWKEIWSTNNATVDVVKNGCTLRQIGRYCILFHGLELHRYYPEWLTLHCTGTGTIDNLKKCQT